MARIPRRRAKRTVHHLGAYIHCVLHGAHDLVAVRRAVARLCQRAPSAYRSDLQTVRIKLGRHLTPTRRVRHLVQHLKAALYSIETRGLSLGQEVRSVVLRFEVPSVDRLGIQGEASVGIAISHLRDSVISWRAGVNNASF